MTFICTFHWMTSFERLWKACSAVLAGINLNTVQVHHNFKCMFSFPANKNRESILASYISASRVWVSVSNLGNFLKWVAVLWPLPRSSPALPIRSPPPPPPNFVVGCFVFSFRLCRTPPVSRRRRSGKSVDTRILLRERHKINSFERQKSRARSGLCSYAENNCRTHTLAQVIIKSVFHPYGLREISSWWLESVVDTGVTIENIR